MLKTAEVDFADGDYDRTASTTYYAMYHAALGALATKGIALSNQDRVIAEFGQHFVKNGPITREIGRELSNARHLRVAGDYDADIGRISRDVAEKQLNVARVFVQSVAQSIGVAIDLPSYRPRTARR